MSDRNKPLLKPKELAEALSVSCRTIYVWVAEGKIPVCRVPGTKTIRFDLDQVKEKMREGAKAA